MAHHKCLDNAIIAGITGDKRYMKVNVLADNVNKAYFRLERAKIEYQLAKDLLAILQKDIAEHPATMQ
jgi:hypothetical protein